VSFYDPLSAADGALLDAMGDEVFRAPPLLFEVKSAGARSAPGEARKQRQQEPSRQNQVGELSRFHPHRECLLSSGPTQSSASASERRILSAGDLCGASLAALDADAGFQVAVLAHLGIEQTVNEESPSGLPGCAELVATLRREYSNRLTYCLPQLEPNGLILTPAEVHAAMHSGRTRALSGPEHAIWKLDLLRSIGWIEPATVTMPILPSGASDAAAVVRDRFAVLLGLKRLRNDGGGPSAFAKQFAGDWCGMPMSTAYRALGELRRAGVIVKAGTHAPIAGRRATNLYLPGGEVSTVETWGNS
jgi:hypothetical protein